MPSRSTARLELAAAAILFSTGGAAIKAADFTGWQITCLRSGHRRDRDLADDPAGARRAGPRAHLVWSAWPTRPASRSSSSPTASPPRRTRSISSPPRRSTSRSWRPGCCGSRPGGRTSRSWPRSASGCALLRRRGPAGGDGAGSGAGQPARAGQRVLLGAHRAAACAGWHRRARGEDPRRSRSCVGQRHRLRWRAPVRAPVRRARRDRLVAGRLPGRVPDRPRLRAGDQGAGRPHSRAGGVADPADRAGAEPGLGLAVPGRACRASGPWSAAASSWAPRPSSSWCSSAGRSAGDWPRSRRAACRA